ncbi:hypothetical protein [Sorangium sp. So ce406]|uniref:hypothetical protein n=1 Tax=Sorangium sp. So ce406 TaxID=3133311 RepID=UPI003F5C8548
MCELRTGQHGWPLGAAPLFFMLGCSFELPPQVPVGSAVPVAFSLPDDSSPYQVKVSGPGRAEQRCALPCAMQVPSGSATVLVSGPRSYAVPVVMPGEPSRAELKQQRRAQASVGWIAVLSGVVAGSTALAVTRDADADGQLAGGIAGIVGGGVGLVGLIVALTAGKDEVRFTRASVDVPHAPEPAPVSLASGAPEERACRSRLDCEGGLVCPKGRCVASACVADKDCSKGQPCTLEGVCAPANSVR